MYAELCAGIPDTVDRELPADIPHTVYAELCAGIPDTVDR